MMTRYLTYRAIRILKVLFIKPRIKPTIKICIADIAAIVGSPCHWISEKICTGIVAVLGPVKNKERFMSPNEMIKENNAPEMIPERIKGKVTLKNA